MKDLWVLCIAILVLGCSNQHAAYQAAENKTRVEPQELRRNTGRNTGRKTGRKTGTTRDKEVTLLDSPAGPGTREAYLTGVNGVVYLSWLESKATGEDELRFSKWEGKTWSDPKVIVSSKSLFVNWADFPSIKALSDGSLVAHWLAKSGTGAYAYDVLVSRSTDSGSTWSPPVRPHRDGRKTEHGFVSLIDQGSGTFSLVWLDGRNFQTEDDGPTSPRKSNEMTLRFTTFENGAIRPEVLLDPRVCECCQTAAVATQDGLFVTYRDRSSEEIRDISFVRYVDGKWTKPKTLYEDGWRIAGCPVNGPAAAADGNKLVVAWPTFASDQGRVHAIFSTDGGKTFGDPVRVDLGNPVGRVDVVWCKDDGGALVSWIEDTDHQTSKIRVRKVWPDGRTDDDFTIADTTSGRASGFPRMVCFGSDVLIAWTDSSQPPRVRVAKFSQSGESWARHLPQ